MKANNSKNTMFAKRVATMLVAIMMGVCAWAAGTDATINFNNGSGTAISSSSVTGDDSESNTWTITTTGTSSYTANASYYQVGSGNSPATSITFTTTLPSVKKITAFSAKFGGFSGTAGTVTLKVGNTTIGSGSLNATNDVTVTNNSQAVGKELTVTVTNISKGVKCYYVSYTFETPQPHTVTFDAQSGNCGTASLDESEGGAGVLLPEATLSDALTTAGWSFFGWATSACAESTTTAPTIVGTTGDRYYPSSNETLYAVYKKNESTFSNDYHKISSVGALESGVDYVIAASYNTNNYAINAEEANYPRYMTQTTVTVTSDVINTTTSKIIWNITKNNDGKIYLKNGDNYLYITAVPKSPSDYYYNLSLSSTITNTNEEWYTPTFAEDGTFTLTSQLYTSYMLSYDYMHDDFASATSAGDGKIFIYKRQRNATYYSNPCDKFMSLTTVNTSTATLAIGTSSIATCGGGAASRQVTLTATPAAGYTFISTSRLNYTGDGTAEYVSGPTANGDDFDFVYQFSQSDNGDGEFSANASPKTYTITLNRNGGAGVAQQVTATYNSATLSAAITVPEKEDHIFNGWYSGENGTGELVISKTGALQANVAGYTGANGIWTKDAATTLYAKWTMHSFVNYRTRCCDLDVVTNLAVSETTENSVTLSWSLPAVMEGIDNFRIVKASDGSTVVDNIDKTATSATVSGLTECETYSFRVASVSGSCKNNSAIIEAIPFEGAKTVTFDYNGGSGSMSEFVTACGAKTVTLPTPNDRDGYTFNGWYNGAVKVGDAGDDYTPTEDITLKAQYTEIPRHSITLKAMGSNYKTIANKLEGSSVWTLIKDEKGPKMTGYAFIGWSVSENSTTVLTEGTAGTLGADKTLHAVYQKAEYKYVKVTATSGITDGQYLIVYESGSVAFDGSLSTLDATDNTIEVVITSNEIAVNAETEAAEFTIDKTNGTIKSASGFYIGVSSNSNGLNVATTAEVYTHNLSIEEGNAVVAPIFEGSTMVLRFNDASNQNRFRYYNGTQKAIQFYKKTAILAPSTEVVIPTLTVANTETANTDELYPGGVAGNIVVEAGGKLTGSNPLAVNNLTINSEIGASGQVMNSPSVSGDIYLDIKLLDGTGTMTTEQSREWYCISAPFEVSFNDGFFWADGTPMGYNVDFQAFVYDGGKRASNGTSGWQRVGGKMEAGKAYLIGFDDDIENHKNTKTICLKAMSNTIPTAGQIDIEAHDADPSNKNWNGVGNPTLHYIALKDFEEIVQCYDNGSGYNPYAPTTHNYVVGTALFMQATDDIDLKAATNSSVRAPRRANAENERYSFCVELAKEGADRCDSRLYVSTSEEATSSYEPGKDMLTMNGTSAKFAALIWTENYGKRLASEDVPMVNNKATYSMGIFAPAAGTYTISTTEASENATLYLTKNGRIYWNLTMGACELDLAQGQNNEYGLVLRAEAPEVSTGVDTVTGDGLQVTGVQKVIIDEHVYILRGEQLYGIDGKAVK